MTFKTEFWHKKQDYFCALCHLASPLINPDQPIQTEKSEHALSERSPKVFLGINSLHFCQMFIAHCLANVSIAYGRLGIMILTQKEKNNYMFSLIFVPNYPTRAVYSCLPPVYELFLPSFLHVIEPVITAPIISWSKEHQFFHSVFLSSPKTLAQFIDPVISFVPVSLFPQIETEDCSAVSALSASWPDNHKFTRRLDALSQPRRAKTVAHQYRIYVL